MNENGDEFIWSEGPFSSTKHRPLLNNMLHKIETYSLLCPSCHEFYENAVTLRPCHHSFCSKCIRRHLCVRNGVKHQRCCPVCNSKIEIRKMNGQSKKLDDDDAIIPNHGLQKAVDEYKQMRSTLFDTLFELQTLRQAAGSTASKGSNDVEATKKAAISSPGKPTGKREGIGSDRASKRPRRSCIGNETYVDGGRDDVIFQSEEKKNDHSGIIDLCAESNPQSHIQHHVEAPATTPVPVVRLQTKNFALTGKKRKELIALCSKEGIDATGSDAVLKDRIKRFADYWKSECDREIHKPAATVVKEFRSQEAKRAKEERSMNNSVEKRRITKMNHSREALGSEEAKSIKVTLSSGNVQFDSEFKETYRNMIAGVCERKGYQSVADMIKNVRKRRSDEEQTEPKQVDSGNDTKESSLPMSNTNPTTLGKSQNNSTASSSSSQSAQKSNYNPNEGSGAEKEANGISSFTPSKNAKVVNPYNRSKAITTPFSTHPRSSPPTVAVIPAYHNGMCNGVYNPYKKSPALSTPASSVKPPSRIVTNTSKPPSTLKLSNNNNAKIDGNILALSTCTSQYKSSTYENPEQTTIPHRSKEGKTWNCKICTFSNVTRVWSRTKPKCVMCNNTASF